MRHEAWMNIENSPVAMNLYRHYRRRMPPGLRGTARWIASPRWETAVNLVRSASRGRVMSGPFQGMQIDLSPVSSRNLLSYVLGTQELELHPTIRRIATMPYGRLLNVGAADGYYAIGLARLMPTLRVTAFEGLADMRPVIARNAAINGVGDRVAVRGFCNEGDLSDALARPADGRTLLIVDIEGGEATLLDPARVPPLSGVDLLVETHDLYVEGVTDLLRTRFDATHEIELIRGRPRTSGDFPASVLPLMQRLMPRLAAELMNERRPQLQDWLFLRARLPPVSLASPG